MKPFSLSEGRTALPKRPKRIGLDFSLTTVNIVLLLIFFFLVSGSLVETEELSVDLAETTDPPLDRLPRPLLLVDTDGRLLLDGQTIDTAGVREALPLDTPRLHILADKDVPAGDLVTLIQDPNLTGFELQLVTFRKIKEPS